MKQVLISQGKVAVENIPAPVVEDGMVLVQAAYSCISTGTEGSIIAGSAESLLRRAMRQPEKVMQVWGTVRNEGLARAVSMVEAKAHGSTAVGYSCAGIVIDKGKDISDIKIGDAVACAGGGAYHAEVVCVPRNLVARVPEGVSLDLAATTTLGSIALQGVRRANPTLGETFVVIGLGVLGQITSQLLRNNGCRVIGLDLESSRIEIAKSLGMDRGILSAEPDVVNKIKSFTDGFGADGVIITAASSSDNIVSAAFQMCRKKGRVVLVGDVGLGLKREDFYQKEIDFLISSSYGPGRYEPNYEEKGLDYPIGYVRWTENRNMQAYLGLLAEGRINIKPLIERIFNIDEADKAYNAVNSQGEKPIITLLNYPASQRKQERKIINASYRPPTKIKSVGVAVIGAGSFAKSMHLPNLKELSHLCRLEAIQDRDGPNAKAAAQRFGARYATTDLQDILNDNNIDTVIITTRHNLHAELALRVLTAGKHVLVEKPLALNRSELNKIIDFYHVQSKDKALPILLTGFNRRFSKYASKIKELIQNRLNPMIINYVMNAGYIPLDHWVHNEEGGGRNLGEACHIYDLFTFLTGSKIKAVKANAIRPATGYYAVNDNFITTLTFEDGSVANLTYTALGNAQYSKEKMEIFCEGKVMLLDDYKHLTLNGDKKPLIKSTISDKGHKEELESFANIILNGGEWPIPLWQQEQATEISLQIEEMIRKE